MKYNPCENCIFNTRDEEWFTKNDYSTCEEEGIRPKTKKCMEKLQNWAWMYSELLY